MSEVENNIRMIRIALSDPDAIEPKCSWAKFPICKLCETASETGMFKDVPEPLTLGDIHAKD